MPNWVTNQLTIKGPEDVMSRFKENSFSKGTSPDDVLDFDKIYPMPKTLNMVSGGHDENAIIAYLSNNCTKELDDTIEAGAISCGVRNMFDKNWISTLYERTKKMIEEDGVDKLYCFGTSDDPEDNNYTLYDAGKIYVNNTLLYGCRDWYNWCCKYWGTKWSLSETYLFYDNGDEMLIEFNTAWSTPTGIIEKLGELYPELTFTCKYADEDFGSNTGEYEVQGFEVEDTVVFDDYCKESQEFAAEILGIDLKEDEDWHFDEKKNLYVWGDEEDDDECTEDGPVENDDAIRVDISK